MFQTIYGSLKKTGGGGGEDSTFIVEIQLTRRGPTQIAYVANKTTEEIITARSSGKIVYAMILNMDGEINTSVPVLTLASTDFTSDDEVTLVFAGIYKYDDTWKILYLESISDTTYDRSETDLADTSYVDDAISNAISDVNDLIGTGVI